MAEIDGTTEGFDVIPEDQEWDTVEQESGQKIEFNEPGDVFVGKYVGNFTITPENGEPFDQQRFTNPQGELYAINGGFKLRRGLSDVEAGSIVRITYMGEIDTGQPSAMRDFRVEVARSVPAGGRRRGGSSTEE